MSIYTYVDESTFAGLSNTWFPPRGNRELTSHDPYWLDLYKNNQANPVSASLEADGDWVGVDGLLGTGNIVGQRSLTSGCPTTISPDARYRRLRAGPSNVGPGYRAVADTPVPGGPGFAYVKGLMSPTIDLATYTGLAVPNTPPYHFKYSGTPRAGGGSLDGLGSVGIFASGFDSPTQISGGAVQPFGPNILVGCTKPDTEVVWDATPGRCVHVRATVKAQTFFAISPATGTSLGSGAQAGVRIDFVDHLGRDIVPGAKYFAVLSWYQDTRELGPLFPGGDIAPTVTANELWVAGSIFPGITSAYLTNLGAVGEAGPGVGWTKDFHFKITKAQAQAVLTAMGSALSPSDLRLNGVNWNVELFNSGTPPIPQFNPVQWGGTFSRMSVTVED